MKKETVEHICSFCGSKKSTHLYTDERGETYLCRSCGKCETFVRDDIF
jgi:ferredoxin